ncbi:hypothetical protein AKG38_08510, partial [Pectobacterium carotovorum subsp. carotovorum]
GHEDFQSSALPTELSGQRGALNRIGRTASTGFCHKAERLRYFQAIVLFASQFLAILSTRLAR